MSSAWHGWLGVLWAKKGVVGRDRNAGRPGRSARFETLEARCLLTMAPTGGIHPISTDLTKDQKAPAVDIAANGDFVTAWTGTVTTDIGGGTLVTHTSPFFRRFAANGQAKDAAQVAASASTNNEDSVDVGVDTSGNFVLVWVDTDGGGDKDIFYQRFNAAGVAQGSATRANTTDADTTQQAHPRVAMADNGEFVIVWGHTPTAGNADVYYRTFFASGVAKTAGDLLVNSTSTNAKTEPVVDVNNLGAFAVAWTEDSGGDKDPMFKVFRADGVFLVGATQANMLDAGKEQSSPSVAIDNRSYVEVAWVHHEDATNDDVYLQRFDNTGSLRGVSDVTVAATAAQEAMPLVASNGVQMLVVWAVMSGAQGDVRYQLYADDLTPHGPTHTYQPAFLENAVAMAMSNDGQYVLASERPSSPHPLIEGINYRYLDATPGLSAPAPASFYLRNSNTTGIANVTYPFGAAVAGMVPISGDWDGNGSATVGLYDPAKSRFYLSNSNTAPMTDVTFGFGAPGLGWIPITGDWDANGADTVGLYDPSVSRFYLRNSNTTGAADVTFGFSVPGAGWKPIAGHWTGLGRDTTGLYNPTTSLFYLRNSNTTGGADTTFGYGVPNSGVLPIAGDWDHLNGTDTIGLYNPATSRFLLRNSNSSGIANLDFGFGVPLTGWLPVTNHWIAGNADSTGLWDPTGTIYYLRNTNSTGMADFTFGFGPASSSWIPLSGDWDGDGVTTAGWFDPSTATVYLRNVHTPGVAQVVYSIQTVGTNCLAIAGDWDGDGIDSVSVYNPLNSRFYILNVQLSAIPWQSIGYGVPGGGWLPIAGDWSNRGADGIGLYDPVASRFYLRNTVTADSSGLSFVFGPPAGGWKPIAGDWNRNGVDTIGLYNPATSIFQLRNSNSSGVADITYAYGPAGGGWKPVMGDWNGVTAASLMTYVLGDAIEPSQVTPQQIEPLVAAALDRWMQAGLSAGAVNALTHVQYVIADLPGVQVAAAAENVIWIDRDAARHGWYLDAADSSFTATGDGTLKAVAPEAADRLDLLSVLSHEMGHLLGLGDLDTAVDSLMSARLAPGIRRLPGTAEIDAVWKRPS